MAHKDEEEERREKLTQLEMKREKKNCLQNVRSFECDIYISVRVHVCRTFRREETKLHHIDIATMLYTHTHTWNASSPHTHPHLFIGGKKSGPETSHTIESKTEFKWIGDFYRRSREIIHLMIICCCFLRSLYRRNPFRWMYPPNPLESSDSINYVQRSYGYFIRCDTNTSKLYSKKKN